MKVESILKEKGGDVQTIRPDRDIATAVDKLRQGNVGALVVSSDGHTVEGILSERDVVRGLAKHGGAALQLAVKDLMTAKVTACGPEDSISHLMQLMTTRRIRHIPVVHEGRLAGIISIGDVVKSRLAELELETTVLRDAYITHS